MIDVPLHTSADHPDLLWLLVPSVLTFVAGLGLGAWSTDLRYRRDDPTTPTEEHDP